MDLKICISKTIGNKEQAIADMISYCYQLLLIYFYPCNTAILITTIYLSNNTGYNSTFTFTKQVGLTESRSYRK